MNLPRLAIKNAQFTFTLVILLVLFGLVSYKLMPRSEDPQFDLPITLIDIVYPGASPSDIESLVINPLEQEIAGIENILKIESQIKNGGARIQIDFIYGVDAEASYNKVKQAVSTVKPQLPSGIQQLLVLKATPTSVAIVQLALWSEPNNYRTMEFYAEQLEKRIEAVPGVRQADVWGFPRQVVAVDVNLALLKHYGLSLNELAAVLGGQGSNITPGFVDASTRRFNVKASGSYESLDDVAQTIVRSGDGFIIRLMDVAQVSFSDYQPNYLAFYQNKPVIFVTAQQRERTNIFELTNAVQDEIADFKTSLPKNVHLETIFEQATSVETRVDGFFENLWQGLIVVGLMSFIFLGLRESLVVIAAVPLSFLIAIGWLDIAGFGLQQMSIVGLIIALGLLVDNAIVVTESIHREKSKFASISEAAASGTGKVGWAITSGTITTMLAFLPMLLIASNTGDFVRSMPVTVVLVLLASLLIALTLTPLLATQLFAVKKSRFKALQHYLNLFAEKIYVVVLAKLLKIKWLVIIASLTLTAGLFALFGQVGVSLFPKAEKPMLLINVETPVNSNLQHTELIMKQVADRVEKYELVESVAINVGSSNPRIYYNEIPKRGITNYGQMLVVLKEFEQQKVTELVSSLRKQYQEWPNGKIEVREFTQGPVTDQPITIRVISESLADLQKVAQDITAKLHKLEGIINIDNPIGESNTEISLNIDYQKAGLYNIDISGLEQTVQAALAGLSVAKFNDDNGQSYPIMLRRKQQDLDGLSEIFIKNRKGEQIPLLEIATPSLSKGQSDFFHYQKLRMAKISADVDKGFLVAERTNELLSYLKHYEMPNGTRFVIGGEEASRQQSFAGLSQIMLVTAIGIFAVLVLQFKSFLQPLIIFTSIPFAMGGAILGLYLAGLSFSMMAFIGLISLFGIVVNNAIILIDTTNRLLGEGLEKQLAVLKASAVRFTPILLTTLTTIGGLLPLTLFGGGLWQPLGIVIISGLCLSALSSFIFVPILVTLLTKEK
jgi:multidrug efflux pump subunit AcrB